jgi:hypothetical protein
MAPNHYTLGSPPPTLACPHCLRHFKTKSGRTRHIQAKHPAGANGPETHASDTAASRSPIPSFPQLEASFHDSSPVPSHFIPSPSPSSSHFIPSPPPSHFIPSPPPSHFIPSPPSSPPPSCDGFIADPNIDMDIAEHPHPNASRITRVFHPMLNGMSIFFIYIVTLTLTFLFVGEICDESGNGLPPDVPPVPRDSDKGPNDWTPYDNRLQFEVADFIFRRNQMSAGDVNFLLNLWAASLAIHSSEPPFSKATHLYDTIDSTPLGDAAWQSFSLQYNGPQPESNVPSWMQAEYDVWFRDPCTLVHNLLSNPDFKSDFDYAPFQERTGEGLHRFKDFMSANWAWKQSVSLHYNFFDLVLMLIMLLGHYC